MIWPENPDFRSGPRAARHGVPVRRARPMHDCSARSARLSARRCAWAPAGCSRPRRDEAAQQGRAARPRRPGGRAAASSASSSASAATVKRDLQGYPTLQRKLLDEITRIEEDYSKCGEVPPPPPDWVEAVAAVANVKSGSEMVQSILEEIKRSVDKIHEKTLGEYRRSYETRHKILEGFMPFWRSVDKNADRGRQEAGRAAERRGRGRCAHGEVRGDQRKTDKAEQMLDGLGLHAVRDRAAGDGGRRGRRVHQLQADRAADVGDGRGGRLPHQLAAHLRGGGAGDHLGRGVDGPVPDGGAAHHAPLPAHRRPERPHAPAHDVDRAVLLSPSPASRRRSR